MSAIFLMLNSLIGEKATSLDIDYLDVITTPDDIGHYEFMHLSDIGEYIKEKEEKYRITLVLRKKENFYLKIRQINRFAPF